VAVPAIVCNTELTIKDGTKYSNIKKTILSIQTLIQKKYKKNKKCGNNTKY